MGSGKEHQLSRPSLGSSKEQVRTNTSMMSRKHDYASKSSMSQGKLSMKANQAVNLIKRSVNINRSKSGSSKDNMHDSDASHSHRKREPADYVDSISNSFGKKYIHSRHGTSSGKEYVQSHHSANSEKESYKFKIHDQSSVKKFIFFSLNLLRRRFIMINSIHGSSKEHVRIKNSCHTSSNKLVIEHHASGKSFQGHKRLDSFTSSNEENGIESP